ncbi:MAG: DUF5362 family protein [Ferruginibacter sp.]
MQENLLDNDLRIDGISAVALSETAKWAKFLAVVGFVLTGLIVLMAIFAGAIISGLLRTGDAGAVAAVSSTAISVLYLIVAAIYFFMSLYLYRFAINMKIALSTTNQENLNISFQNLKSVYKVMGIITIIYLALIALIFILAIGSVFMLR